jgi:hypothetical protein
MSDDRRFREVNDYAACHGFHSGFPNFHQADYGDGVVYGTMLLSAAQAEWRDVPRIEYGVFHIEDVPAMFRAANDYAARNGYEAAFPNFHQADHGQGVVYGTILLKPGVTEWRDVPRNAYGVYDIEDVGAMMRAANDYAGRNGFAAAFPNFHQADHGQGVVYGTILFHPGMTVWRDVPADLLRMFSTPPERWAIVLCHASDVMPGIDALQRYVNFFTPAGSGRGEAHDYWRDMSYCVGSLQGSVVFGWFDIRHTRAQITAAGRSQVFQWGIEAAGAHGNDLKEYPHRIVVVNVNSDHGKVSGGVLLAYEDSRALEPTFIMHEMGHEFGLDHSFGESSNPCASGDGRPGAYCDVFDIMSAMNVRSFNDAQNRRSGPSLNALSRERLGWLHRSRIWWGKSILQFDQTITLAAVNRPNVEGYLLAKFEAPSRDPAQTSRNTYTLEYRESVGWDRAISGGRVLIHEIRTDGLLRLLTNSNNGTLLAGDELTTPGSAVTVRVISIDYATHTARVRIWTPKSKEKEKEKDRKEVMKEKERMKEREDIAGTKSAVHEKIAVETHLSFDPPSEHVDTGPPPPNEGPLEERLARLEASVQELRHFIKQADRPELDASTSTDDTTSTGSDADETTNPDAST